MSRFSELAREVGEGLELSRAEVFDAVAGLLDPGQPEGDRVDFLVALATRGETITELAAFTAALRERAEPFPETDRALVDVCGTGGDGRHTFNVSTCVAFILASLGVPVAKHGNRGVSSRSGSFDVLEELGVRWQMTPAQSAECLARHDLCFLFAPDYHPVFRELAPLRKAASARGSRTVFNLLGPLLNPARPKRQLIGVPRLDLPVKYARVMRATGLEEGMAVCGRTRAGDPMDELSVTNTSEMSVFVGDSFSDRELEMDWVTDDDSQFEVADAKESAAVIRGILLGEDMGPRRDLVLVNAAAALLVAGRVADFQDALLLASEEVESGRAASKLADLEFFRP
jgi:anthranilate phosphoribosyltransferase